MSKIINQTKTNLTQIVIFAIAFAVFGQIIPNFFYKIMPGDFFYKTRNVYAESIEYAKCPTTSLYLERYVKYPTHGARIVELQLIKSGGEVMQLKLTNEEKNNLNDTFIIEKTDGYQPLNIDLHMPCNTKLDQTYRWQILVLFPIYGYEKTVEIQSEPFYLPVIN